MKRMISILLTLCVIVGLVFTAAVSAGAAGEDIFGKIADPNFRAAVYKELGKQPGEPLTAEECAAVDQLFLNYLGIESLAGIEYFIGLEALSCDNNKLKFLDLSALTNLKTLTCMENRLTGLDVSKNLKLELLRCDSNQLTALDVSNNLRLVDLTCNNNQLAALDVSRNPELINLMCSNNKLSVLDISHNPVLIDLFCDNNNLRNLRANNNPELKLLHCYDNKLKALDLSNIPKLNYLACERNYFSSKKSIKALSSFISEDFVCHFYPQNSFWQWVLYYVFFGWLWMK